jgi:hypothetical protein
MYVSEVDSPSLSVDGQFSLDGTNGFTLPMIQGTLGYVNLYLNPGQTSYMIGAGDVVGPMFRVSVSSGSSTSYPPSATVSVTLYLMPN